MVSLVCRAGIIALATSPAALAAANLEYAVKANYLYKFAPFVTWPSQAFASSAEPFQICVIGEDPFGPALDDAVKGQQIGLRRIVVRRMQRIDGPMGCHIAFVAGSRTQPVAEIIRVLRNQPVLTVADEQQGAGCAIRFLVKGGRVRFIINRAAAAQGDLSISSKLLDLALSVES